MKIRAKQARDVVLYQEWPGEKEIVPIFDYMNFTQANAMAQTPFMLWQFANYLDQQSSEDLKITAHISLSLNNRPHQPFIDSSHDITSESYPWFGHADWILPLDKDAPIHDYSVLTEE